MDLARTQFLSLFTKAVTTALGIAQSIIVIRILSPAEYGLVGLVMSVGGVIGVSQHLGIVDGAIREIAVLKSRREVGKVFWVSHLVRQAVTIPLSVGLLLLAGVIAKQVYGRPEITLFLQIFAGVLTLQGLQDVLGATLTGMKKFVSLYVIQIVTATLNVAVFGYLTWRLNITGFFLAIVLTTSIMIILLAGVITRALRHNLGLPSWDDVKHYGWRVMRIGAFMYLARIFFIVWQRLPILLLGGVLAAEELGYLNVSQTFGSKLTIIAMALAEVNLSWMSSLYTSGQREFKQVLTRNMRRVLLVMMLIVLVLLFFTPEILRYVIGGQYGPAQPIILVMTLGFFLYALTDIGSSSLFVSADQPKLRAYTYGLMTAISGVAIALLLLKPDPFLATLAVLAGALVSYVATVLIAQRRFGINFLTEQLAWLLVALAASVLWLLSEPDLSWRILIFALLLFYVVREGYRSKLIPGWLALGVKKRQTSSDRKVVCFAGAAYDQPIWTNRQQIMSRVAKEYPVLYVEPRVWIGRFWWQNLRQPKVGLSFLKRLVWYERVDKQLFVKAQWNLIPGSREVKAVALFNHLLNRWCVLATAWWLGFNIKAQPSPEASAGKAKLVVWIYDTEAAEYLSAFDKAKVVYDCVDDHAAQAGPDRNAKRVEEEERAILKRADLVTVTSRKLLALKQPLTKNIQLVLNAGDVALYAASASTPGVSPAASGHPVFGSVGALDAYKYDFELLGEVARKKPDWNFVLVGAPVVGSRAELEKLARRPNIQTVGAVPRQEAPAYVKSFDVCLIPYRASKYNEASFPLKFWEFMATGKPILVSGLPELKAYRPFIGYASSPAEFIRQGEIWLADKERWREKRIYLARGHSWEKRAEHLLTKLKEILCPVTTTS